MSDSHDDSAAAAFLNTIVDNLQKASSESFFASVPSNNPQRFFVGRRSAVHDLLGGGHTADVLLWRKKHLSAGFVAGVTVIWMLFEWVGFHLVSVLSFLLLVIVVALFAWSNGAAFLKRPPPPIPKLELSDDLVLNVAKTLKVEINRILAVLSEIAIGSDLKRFLKLAGGLTLLVLFGSWFSFVTLLFIAIIAAHTLPVLYEKNEDAIDGFAQKVLNEANKHFQKIDTQLLSKIPRGPSKQTKSE